jgi:hypothetical protein
MSPAMIVVSHLMGNLMVSSTSFMCPSVVMVGDMMMLSVMMDGMNSPSSLSPTMVVGNVLVNGCNSMGVSMGMSIHTDVQTVVLDES